MRISLRVMMLSASIACCGTPSSASAQLQPLVMTHGIRSDASTWDNTAFQLGLAFPVSVRRYTTAWKTSYAAQANQLLGSVFVGVPDTTLAVGHSNGGLVLRQAAVSNAPLRGIATIGSPNFGAPAADAIRKNYMPDIIAPILITGQSISYVLSPPDPADPDEQWYYDYVVATGSNMVDLIEAILNLAEFDPSFGIWNSMYPTSPFMQEINSSASLATQAQRAPIRASIRTYLNNPDEAFWRLAIAQENVVYYTATRDFATLIALEAGFFFTDKYCYRQPYQNGKCNGASLFGQLASDLQLIEGRYCYKMQLEDAAGAYAMPCFSTDAVVPIERQMWGPQGFAVPYEFQGPSHTEQPRSASVRLALEAFLQTQANVARCGEGPAYQAQIAAQSTDILPNTTTALGVSVVKQPFCGDGKRWKQRRVCRWRRRWRGDDHGCRERHPYVTCGCCRRR
jgi:pimeloyl-ACP methyl ester carboxylesterase